MLTIPESMSSLLQTHSQCALMLVTGFMVFYVTYKIQVFMNRRLVKDKIVLITGASSGIGRACAQAFYKAGAKVILASRNVANLNAVKNDLMKSSGHEPSVIPIDMADYDSIRKAAREVLEKFGHVDILVNNAGQAFRGAALTTDITVQERVMKVNYFGHIVLTQQLLPAMIQNGGGDIVCVSSIQGKAYVPYRTAYGASKHALECYFDCLRAEHADDNIRVCICCPSYTRTPFTIDALRPDGSRLGRMDEDLENGMPVEYVGNKILEGVEYGTKHMLLGPIHHRLLCHLPNTMWNFAAFVMKIKARKDKPRWVDDKKIN